MHNYLPTLFVFKESVGNLFDTGAPGGEDDSVASFKGEEGTEVEASQRWGTVCVEDVLVYVFPRDPSSNVQTVVIRHVGTFLVLLVCHPPSEVCCAIIVEKAG